MPHLICRHSLQACNGLREAGKLSLNYELLNFRCGSEAALRPPAMPGAASEWIAELNQVAILEEVSSEIGQERKPE